MILKEIEKSLKEKKINFKINKKKDWEDIKVLKSNTFLNLILDNLKVWKKFWEKYFNQELNYNWKIIKRSPKISKQEKEDFGNFNITQINIDKLINLSPEEIKFILYNILITSKDLIENHDIHRINLDLFNIKNKEKKFKNPNFLRNLQLKSSLKWIYSHKELLEMEKKLWNSFANWCIEEIVKNWCQLPEIREKPKSEIEINISKTELKYLND